MTDSVRAVRAALEAATGVLLVPHAQPDADAIGSCLGLQHALTAMGKSCVVVSKDPAPATCAFLPGCDVILRPDGDGSSILRSGYDTVAVLDVDCTREERLGAPQAVIAAAARRLIIDHHATSSPTADVNWIDATKAATGEMIFGILNGWAEITPATAQCLYTAICFDTGGFRFRNTSASVMAVGSRLIELGADPARTASHLFEEHALGALLLLGRALDRIHTNCEGRLAWSWLTTDDFAATETTDEATEGIVNYINSLQGGLVGILFRQVDPNGPVRVSLRSRPPLDVAAIAARFGGGGHELAAGCRLQMDIDTAQEQVLQAVREAIAATGE